MARRKKLPPSSRKVVNPIVAPVIARREEPPALDEDEVPEPTPADAPTGPVLAIVHDPPMVNIDSEMTARVVVDGPEHLVAPDRINPGDPMFPAAPPRRAPPGDCRSLRRAREGGPALFALVYRHGASLVMRTGTVGTYGVWRVVDYPTPAAASRAYAREVGVYVDDGYTDVG